MFIIKTQKGKLLNMDHIEAIFIVGTELLAVTPCFNAKGNYDQYPLYTDDNKEHLEKALDCLFESLTNRSSGFDCSVPAKWEKEI